MHDLAADLIGAIKTAQREIAASLVAGNATDFAVYQRLVGRYDGLTEALNILEGLQDADDQWRNNL